MIAVGNILKIALQYIESHTYSCITVTKNYCLTAIKKCLSINDVFLCYTSQT